MGRPREAYCKRGHPRTPENVTSNRHCRECHNAARRTGRPSGRPRAQKERAPRAPYLDPRFLSLPGLEIICDYQHGDTLAQIATTYHCDPKTIGNRLRAWGVPLRRSGPVKGTPNWKLRKELPLLEIMADYQAGDGLRAIAARVGVDKATVGKRLREAGITLRPRKGSS